MKSGFNGPLSVKIDLDFTLVFDADFSVEKIFSMLIKNRLLLGEKTRRTERGKEKGR